MLSGGILLSFAAAFFKSGKSVTTKMASMSTNEYLASFATRFVALIFIGIAFIFIQDSSLPSDANFWIVLIFNAFT